MSVTKPNETDFRGTYIDSVEGGVDCAYPNCRSGKVVKAQAYVVWDASLDLNLMFTRVAPVIKLAMQEHLHPHELEDKYLPWSFILHPECAAEWGMQLISDGLKANSQVGRVLSHRGEIK
jgi:hypothetical protein